MIKYYFYLNKLFYVDNIYKERYLSHLITLKYMGYFLKIECSFTYYIISKRPLNLPDDYIEVDLTLLG